MFFYFINIWFKGVISDTVPESELEKPLGPEEELLQSTLPCDLAPITPKIYIRLSNLEDITIRTCLNSYFKRDIAFKALLIMQQKHTL